MTGATDRLSAELGPRLGHIFHDGHWVPPLAAADDILLQVREYFADAECDSDAEGYIPNEEMRLLVLVDDYLRARGIDGRTP